MRLMNPDNELEKWRGTTEEIRILNDDVKSSKKGYSTLKILMWTLIFSSSIGFLIGILLGILS